MKEFLIIVPEGGILFESTGVADLLQKANQSLNERGLAGMYRINMATTQDHHVVRGNSGLTLLANSRLSDLDPTQPRDTIIVTGRGVVPDEQERIADWIRFAAPHTRRTASICGGALLLAKAGVLNGKSATTHWRLLAEMERDYPNTLVENGPMFVQDGTVWTSAGVSAGFDLVLAMIEEDCGFHTARDIAQEMVMFLRRPGDQAQFSRYRLPESAQDGPIREVQRWIQLNLSCDLSIDHLADRAAMSARNFSRVFTKQIGITPAKYIEEMRINAVRDHLEQTSDTIETIARLTGFQSSLTLRRTFERHLHITPSEYRQRFAPYTRH